MDRKDKILRHIRRDGAGIEIGPGHSPIAPKSEGFNVSIIDHVGRDELIEKYTGHGLELDRIEEVDFVWRGESYPNLTGRVKHYDWIIASHLIEHTPDLIGFLNGCDDILKEDGVLSLAIPDKRYCFDHYRPISGLARVIDSHLNNAAIHSAGTVAEYFLNVVSKAGTIAWDRNTAGDYRTLHSVEEARQGIALVTNQGAYMDVHAWCFVPHSFRLILDDLHQLGLTALREVDYAATEGHEFFVTLGRHGTGPQTSRLEMQRRIAAEEQAGESVEPAPNRALLTG